MNEEEIDKLTDIFYREAPFDFILSIENRKRKYVLGSCTYVSKVCSLYGLDNYMQALIVMLHEIAHARIQHKTHSAVWEKEFIRLLTIHNVPRDNLSSYAVIITPSMQEFINAS